MDNNQLFVPILTDDPSDRDYYEIVMSLEYEYIRCNFIKLE